MYPAGRKGVASNSQEAASRTDSQTARAGWTARLGWCHHRPVFWSSRQRHLTEKICDDPQPTGIRKAGLAGSASEPGSCFWLCARARMTAKSYPRRKDLEELRPCFEAASLPACQPASQPSPAVTPITDTSYYFQMLAAISHLAHPKCLDTGLNHLQHDMHTQLVHLTSDGGPRPSDEPNPIHIAAHI